MIYGQKKSIKRKVKIITGSAGALLLLVFVFYMALFSRTLVNQNSSDIYFDLNYLEVSATPVTMTAPDLSGLVLETGKSETQIHANWLTSQKGAFELLWREKNGSDAGAWTSALMGRFRTGMDGMYTYNVDLNSLSPDRKM